MSATDRLLGALSSLAIKAPVKAGTTANITLSALQTIDGVALAADDRVLVKNQTAGAENGIYIADTSTWERAPDFDGNSDVVKGTMVRVTDGSTLSDSYWAVTTANPITIDTTSITFSQVNNALTGVSAFVATLLDEADAAAFRNTIGIAWCGTATGTANALVLTPAQAITALAAGIELIFKSGAAANTAATTIAVSGLAATAVQSNGAACVGGEIEISKWYRATYDGAAFQLERLAPSVLLEMFTTAGDLLYATADQVIARLASGVEMWLPTSGRLTLTTAVPVTTSDVTAATTVYFTPYKGNVVQLYDGATWIPTIFSELSQATTDATKSPAAVGASSNYDVFVWNDAGPLRATRGPAWATDTTRGTGAGTTELEVLEGRHVNKVAITNGPGAQRGLYVGTIRSNASSQINDSLALRHVSNNYNEKRRPFRGIDSTDSWTYTTAAWRKFNNATTADVSVLCGLPETMVAATVVGLVNSNSYAVVGLGIDSGTVNSGQIMSGARGVAQNAYVAATCFYNGSPGIGVHTLSPIEYGDASAGTWLGDAGTVLQTGIAGVIWG